MPQSFSLPLFIKIAASIIAPVALLVTLFSAMAGQAYSGSNQILGMNKNQANELVCAIEAVSSLLLLVFGLFHIWRGSPAWGLGLTALAIALPILGYILWTLL